jgi:hypothetical protein
MREDHSTHTEADAGRFERAHREDDFYGTEHAGHQVLGSTGPAPTAQDTEAVLAALDAALPGPAQDPAEAQAEAWHNGPATIADDQRGYRCGACKSRHASADDVRWCYDLRAEMRAEAEAEQAAEVASDRAYARSREAQAEAGTWFGPVTEADSWGEDDEALDQAEIQRARNVVIHTGLASGEGDCEGGVCEDINRLCSKHQRQYQGRYGRASNE